MRNDKAIFWARLAFKKIECGKVAIDRVDPTENLHMQFVERAKTAVDWATMDEDKKTEVNYKT